MPSHTEQSHLFLPKTDRPIYGQLEAGQESAEVGDAPEDRKARRIYGVGLALLIFLCQRKEIMSPSDVLSLQLTILIGTQMISSIAGQCVSHGESVEHIVDEMRLRSFHIEP
jgi:hypothetical protein